MVSGKGLCRATGSATWAHLMASCGFPTIQVEYRLIVHLPSCSCKAGGLSCLCSLLPQSGKLVHLGYNGLLSHQYVVQERLWGVGLQHGFLLALTATFWKPVAHYNNMCFWLQELYLCLTGTCEALPQNSEQVTFWVKWVFGIIVRSTLSALIWYQNQVHDPEIWPFVYKTWIGFSGSVILRNRLLKFPNPKVLDLTGCRKCKFFCGKIDVWKLVRNYI